MDKRFDQSLPEILNGLASFAAENLLLSNDDHPVDQVLVLYFAGYGSRRRISDHVDALTGEPEYEQVFVPTDSPNRND